MSEESQGSDKTDSNQETVNDENANVLNDSIDDQLCLSANQWDLTDKIELPVHQCNSVDYNNEPLVDQRDLTREQTDHSTDQVKGLAASTQECSNSVSQSSPISASSTQSSQKLNLLIHNESSPAILVTSPVKSTSSKSLSLEDNTFVCSNVTNGSFHDNLLPSGIVEFTSRMMTRGRIMTKMAHTVNVSDLRPALGSGSQNRESVIVYSNYSKLGEHLRQVTPPELQCSVFCGGKRCKYDSSDSWKPIQMAIDGIFSHWVTDGILAMARPNTEIIAQKDVVGQFLRNDIKTIINLQIPGEHASCGGPLTESGYSYDPNVFMERGIFYYNFGLRDFGEPTLTLILDMVKVMAFSLTEGKVAVHCHAGLGRTGVLIACYLVYSLRVRANDAIRYVRIKRPQAVQTSGQILIIQEFEAFILPQLYIFCNRDFIKDKRNVEFNLQQFLARQRVILHGYEARALKYIPKMLYVICERLLKLCGCGGPASNSHHHLLAPLEFSYMIGTPAFTTFFLSAQYDHENSRVSYSAPHSLGSPLFSASLSSHSREARQLSEDDSGITGGEFSIGDVSLPNSAQYINRGHNAGCLAPDVPSCMSGLHEQCIDNLLNDGIINQKLAENCCYQELASQVDLRRAAAEENVKTVLPMKVYEAFLMDHDSLGPEFKKKLRNYRVSINVKQSSWESLNTESDLYILTALLFTWLEHLRQPVLSVDVLSIIVLASHKPDVCLRRMEKEQRYTIEYMVRFVSRLQPLTRPQHELLLKRVIASFCQQSVLIGEKLMPTVIEMTPSGKKCAKDFLKFKRKAFNKLREGTLRKSVEFFNNLFDAVYLETSCDSRATEGGSICDSAIARAAFPDESKIPSEEKLNQQNDDLSEDQTGE